MNLIKVEGIVTSETNYSESSKILSLLTKEKGKINVISKGCRSLKSKLRSVSSKFTYGTFHIYYKEEGLSTLSCVDVLSPFKNILSDITKISYATYLMDLAEQVLKQTDEDLVYPILIEALKRMDEGLSPSLLTSIVELKFLALLGVQPNVDACNLCGSTKNIKTISVDNGGYICANCYQNEKIYSDKMIKLMRLFFYVDLSKLTSLSVSETVQKEIEEFIDLYYDQYTGLYLRSKQFLNNLKKLG